MMDSADTKDYLQVGMEAPTFSLPNARGDVVESASLLAKHALVISFYRGRWCPYCSEELKALQLGLPDFEDAGAQLVAISPELPDDSMTIHEKRALAFPILSDVGNEVARRFGVVVSIGESQKKAMLAAGVDLTVLNGDASWEVPLPATFVVDRQSTIRYAFVNEDITQRPPVSDIVHSLRALG